tara:strand:+ start:329 stop:2017 length:1689 start_codon:yes stop_codon:yes gene_type:complete
MISDKQPIIATYKIDKIKKSFFFNLSIENQYKKIINKNKNKKINYEKNFYYCIKIYEKILPDIVKNLNFFYKTNYSIKFWEILIGYWLLRLIQIHKNYFNDYRACNKKRKIIVSEFDKKIFECNNYSEFNIQTTHFKWNENYISFLSKYFFKKKNIVILKSKNINKNYLNILNIKNNLIRSKFKKYFFYNLKKENIIDSHVYFDPLLGRNTDINFRYLINKSKIKFKLYDKKNFQFYKTKFNSFKYKKNHKLVFNTKKKDIFFQSLFEVITLSLPNEINYYIKKKIKQKLSNKIFTVGPHLADGLHKFKIAHEIERGSELYLKQLGGVYGTCKNLVSEYFDLKISDKFLSWGWNHKNKFKTLPSYSNLCDSLKKFTKFNEKKKKRNILIVGCKLTLLFREFGSRLQPEQVYSYIKRNSSLIADLEKKYKNHILFKKHIFLGQCLMTDMLNKKKLSHVTTDKNFYKLVRNSKLVIHTSNSTTMLETLSINVPTILFWKKEEWPIHDYVKPLFNDLKKNNIIFYDKDKLIKFINKNYHDFDKWWQAEKVQNLIIKFNKLFVNTL